MHKLLYALMYKGHFIWLMVIIELCSACNCLDTRLNNALEVAGNNRVELEKVLERYKNCDKQKYRAACFLIRNMPFYNSYEGEALQKYLHYFETHSINNRGAQIIVDSLLKVEGPFYMSMLAKKRDIETVDSAFLVEHIDWAFKVWREQPWGKNVSFDDFCEYILPYRIGNEPLSFWRKDIYERYNPLLDSIRKTELADDPLQAAQVLLTHLRKWKYRYTGLFPKGPHVGPKILDWKAGSCREFADCLIYVLRAVGIPCGVDKVMVRGDLNMAHFWNFVLDKNGDTYVTDLSNQNRWMKAPDFDLAKGKVYRTTYSLNEEMVKRANKISKIDSKFKYPFFHDVTSIYADSLALDISIPESLLYYLPEREELIYLCMASKQNWIPVDYTSYLGNGVVFRGVAGGVTCMLVSDRDNALTPLCTPFHIDCRNGILHFFTPQKELCDINLYTKYPIGAYAYCYNRMRKGIIEGSNCADFKGADTLFMIQDAPFRRYSTALLKSEKKYRYVRYRGRDGSHSIIAELAFYEHPSDTFPLKGKILGTPGCRDDDGLHEYTNVFDGNTDTSFDYKYPNGGWAGLDFGKPCRVKKAVYTPANRIDFIYRGDLYELFYWDKGQWLSAGQQTALSDSLVYSVPKNALLYLKNHSNGEHERIFEYKDGKQVFR